MNKTGLNDPRLSFKAKGILAYLLSKPDHWQTRVSDLANHAADGKDAVKSGLRELKSHGYVTYELPRNEKGRYIEGGYTVFEVSQKVAESPATENPLVDKPPPSNNEPSKNEYKDSVPSSLCPQGGDDEKPKEKPKSVLHPQSESDQLLFDLINKQRKAKGWGPAKKFTNLAIAEKYRSAACNLDGHLETAIQCAFTNIGSIALKDVVNYVAKWKPGGPKRENSRRNSRQNVDPSWKPGNPTGLGEWSDADLAYFASLTFDDAVDAPG